MDLDGGIAYGNRAYVQRGYMWVDEEPCERTKTSTVREQLINVIVAPDLPLAQAFVFAVCHCQYSGTSADH